MQNEDNLDNSHMTHFISFSTLSNHSYPNDISPRARSAYLYDWSSDQSTFKMESKRFQLLKPSSLTWRADLPIEKSRRFITLKSFKKGDQAASGTNGVFMRNIAVVKFEVLFSKDEELSQSFINEVKKNEGNEMTETALKELKTNLAHFEEENLIMANECLPNEEKHTEPHLPKRKQSEKISKIAKAAAVEKRNKTKSPKKTEAKLEPLSNKKETKNKVRQIKPKSQEKEKRSPRNKEKKNLNNKIPEKPKKEETKAAKRTDIKQCKKEHKDLNCKPLKINKTLKDKDEKVKLDSHRATAHPSKHKQNKKKKLQHNQHNEEDSNIANRGNTSKSKTPQHKTLLYANNKLTKKSLPSTSLSKTRIPSSNDTRYALLGKTFCVNSSLNDFNHLGNTLQRPHNKGNKSKPQNSEAEIEKKTNRDLGSKFNSFELKYTSTKLPTKQKIDLSSCNNGQELPHHSNNNSHLKNIMRISVNEQYTDLKPIINTHSPNLNSTNNNRDFDSNLSTKKVNNIDSSHNDIKKEAEKIVFNNREIKEANEKKAIEEAKKPETFKKVEAPLSLNKLKSTPIAFRDSSESGGFLKRICCIIDSKIKELSFNEVSSQSKNSFSDVAKDQKKKWREDFSQTYTLYFPQYPKRLMSNITQRHFNNKMNFYKQLCHSPFNPYSPNFSSEMIGSKANPKDLSAKHSSQELPAIQSKPRLVSLIAFLPLNRYGTTQSATLSTRRRRINLSSRATQQEAKKAKKAALSIEEKKVRAVFIEQTISKLH